MREADDPLLDTLAALAREDPEETDDASFMAEVEALSATDDETRARYAAAALTAFTAGGDEVSSPPNAVEGAGGGGTERPDNVLAFPRRRLSVGTATVTLLAVAAAVALWWVPSPSQELPRYGAEVEGGVVALRGADRSAGEPPVLGPDDRLGIVLRPDVDVEGPIAAAGVVMVEGDARPWRVPPPLPSGNVVIEGTASELGLWRHGPGVRRLVVVVGRPDALPTLGVDTPATGPGWQVFDVVVRLKATGRG